MRILAREAIEKPISMHEVIAAMEDVFPALTRQGVVVPERAALTLADSDVDVSQPRGVESIIGSRFTGRVIETTTFGE